MTAWPVCDLYLWLPHEGSRRLGGVFGVIIMLKNTTQDSLWRKGIMLCFRTSQFMLGWKWSCFPSWITLPLCCSTHAQTTNLPPPYLTVDSCFGARMLPHKAEHIWALADLGIVPSSGYDAEQVDFSSLDDPGKACSEWHMSWKTTLWPQLCSWHLAWKSQARIKESSNACPDTGNVRQQCAGWCFSSTTLRRCRKEGFRSFQLPTFVTAPVSALLGCCSFYDWLCGMFDSFQFESAAQSQALSHRHL